MNALEALCVYVGYAPGPRIVKRNFDPGFFVEHFVKDMGIALSEAKRCALFCCLVLWLCRHPPLVVPSLLGWA
jgi:hypothetical protein